MKKIFTFGAFIVIMLIYACTNSEVFNKNDLIENQLNVMKNTSNVLEVNYKSSEYTLLYTANQKNKSITESELKIYDSKQGSSLIAAITFSIDVDQPAYKLIQHKKVVQRAQELSNDLKQLDLDIQNLANQFEIFGRMILKEGKVEESSPLIESLFFHNAILNTINRSKINNTDCGCTPYNAYFVGKSSFWCQEDYYISPKAVIKKIEQTGYILNDKEVKVYDFLKDNEELVKISIDKVNNVLINKETFNRQVLDYYNSKIEANSNLKVARQCSDCYWGICGNQLGCCGNYSGCCWLATLDCFIHDVDCLECDHWHCGPGCKPGMQ